jgi:hypothetical protein
MKKYFISILSLLFIMCGPNKINENIVSINSTVNTCGKALGLGKTTGIIIVDTLTYCSAERLYWEYDEVVQMLHLLHTRFYQNCSSVMKMQVVKENDIYVIRDVNINKDALEALCVCPYNTYSEISLLKNSIITILINSKSYTIDVKNKSGEIILNSESSCRQN